MNVQKGRLVSGGRLQVPAEFRHALGLKDGDSVNIELRDGQLYIRPFRDVLREIQMQARAHIGPGRSIVDEFIADRRAEAAKE